MRDNIHYGGLGLWPASECKPITVIRGLYPQQGREAESPVKRGQRAKHLIRSPCLRLFGHVVRSDSDEDHAIVDEKNVEVNIKNVKSVKT